MAKLIHTMVRVLDLERSLRFYHDAFGLEEVHRLDFPTFALVYLRNGENDFEVELTLNKDRKEPYTHGDGYGHFAVCVEDVARERELALRPGENAVDRRGAWDRREIERRAGELMPEKSTYFYPKLASGLVFDLVGPPWV